MVQANFMRDFQPRGVVAVHNGAAEAQHTYDPHIRMEDALKRDAVERSQLMYKHEMIDNMLSQLANIDQDTNLPVNSYDIDLPIWMSLDQGDPFADVELGSDLSNLRDRFFPDPHRLHPDSKGLGTDHVVGHAGDMGGMGHKVGGPAMKKSRGGNRKNSSNSGSSSDTSNLAKGGRDSTVKSSQQSGSAKANGRKSSGTKLGSGSSGSATSSKLIKKSQNGGKNAKANASTNGNNNGRGSPRPNGSDQSSNEGDHTHVSNGNGLHRRKKHHNPWTAEETQALIEGVGICGGGKWADIKKLGLKAIERRSPVDLKDKWRNLLRVALLPQQTLRQIERKREVSSEMLARVRVLSTKYKVPNIKKNRKL